MLRTHNKKFSLKAGFSRLFSFTPNIIWSKNLLILVLINDLVRSLELLVKIFFNKHDSFCQKNQILFGLRKNGFHRCDLTNYLILGDTLPPGIFKFFFIILLLCVLGFPRLF